METLTTKETKMLTVFINESIECCGWFGDGENMSYTNANDLQAKLGWDKQSIGGVMVSLLEKGAISDTGGSPRGDKVNDFYANDENSLVAEVAKKLLKSAA